MEQSWPLVLPFLLAHESVYVKRCLGLPLYAICVQIVIMVNVVKLVVAAGPTMQKTDVAATSVKLAGRSRV
jgi:hypothetical protein